MKLFDRFTVKNRNFVAKESNLIEVMKMFNAALFAGYYRGGMTVNKGEEHEWLVQVNLSNYQWRALLEECKNKKYQLVIKDNPDKMYFAKMEGSK